MTKKESLVDKIKARQSQNVSGRNRGLVAVLAQKEEIRDALAHGFTMREIHAVLVEEGKMPVRYNAFTRLVNNYVKGKGQPKMSQKDKNPPQKTPSKRRPGVYDPDNIDIDDLI